MNASEAVSGRYRARDMMCHFVRFKSGYWRLSGESDIRWRSPSWCLKPGGPGGECTGALFSRGGPCSQDKGADASIDTINHDKGAFYQAGAETTSCEPVNVILYALLSSPRNKARLCALSPREASIPVLLMLLVPQVHLKVLQCLARSKCVHLARAVAVSVPQQSGCP